MYFLLFKSGNLHDEYSYGYEHMGKIESFPPFFLRSGLVHVDVIINIYIVRMYVYLLQHFKNVRDLEIPNIEIALKYIAYIRLTYVFGNLLKLHASKAFRVTFPRCALDIYSYSSHIEHACMHAEGGGVSIRKTRIT